MVTFPRGWAGLWALSGMLTAMLLPGTGAYAQSEQPAGNDNAVTTIHVQGGIYMLAGRGGNVAVQIGEDGILLVDTMVAERSDELLAAIRELSNAPIRYILNTHYHSDHTGGNAAIAKAGETLNNDGFGRIAGAQIWAHENVLNKLVSVEPPPPVEALPTSTYFTDRRDFYLNGEPIYLLHQANAHTDGDTLILFRRSDVIVTGDIFNTTGYPFIDVENGGTIQGIIDALNLVIEMAVPAYLQEGGTMVIPGHGRVCDEQDVVEYRDMLTIIRSSIREMIDEGQSLREVQRARPTMGFDVRYGIDLDFYNTEQFVEDIYKELSQ
jgi:cyclase